MIPNQLLERSAIASDEGALIGRHPHHVTAADYAAAGVAPLTPMKAIRAYCLECSGGRRGEVRKCVAVSCPLWPLRLGRFPRRLGPRRGSRPPAPAAEP